jgi:predicted small integral membrane protein
MTPRLAKAMLVFGVAFYTSLIALNNLSDYRSNYLFVQHVLMMDSTFPGNHAMWRAVDSPAWHIAFYWMIIVWECTSAALCGWGGVRLARSMKSNSTEFQRAKNVAIAGLTINLLIWVTAFLAVGGEWFLMWQSKTWNGEGAAFRMFTIVGIVLLLLTQPEAEGQSV